MREGVVVRRQVRVLLHLVVIVVEYGVHEAGRDGFSKRDIGYCGGGGCGCTCDSSARHFVHIPKFDQAVADGRMPQPRTLDGCVLWDVREIDERFDDLPRRAQAGAPVAPGDVDWDDVAA